MSINGNTGHTAMELTERSQCWVRVKRTSLAKSYSTSFALKLDQLGATQTSVEDAYRSDSCQSLSSSAHATLSPAVLRTGV